MRKIRFVAAIVAVIASIATLVTLTSAPASASRSYRGPSVVTAVHGVPGLPSDVDVTVDGRLLTTFGFGELDRGVVRSGSRLVEVRLGGQTILSAQVEVQPFRNYSVVAHLTESGAPTLTVFENNNRGLARGNGRVVVRHTAAAPTVDIVVNDGFAAPLATISNANGAREARADVPASTYNVKVAADVDNSLVALNADLTFRRFSTTYVYAVGQFSTDPALNTFTVVVDRQLAIG
jgi:hypothetical protein